MVITALRFNPPSISRPVRDVDGHQHGVIHFLAQRCEEIWAEGCRWTRWAVFRWEHPGFQYWMLMDADVYDA
jgi:hypothetical protein